RKQQGAHFRRRPQYTQPRGVHLSPGDPAIPSLPGVIMTVGFAGDRDMAHRLLVLYGSRSSRARRSRVTLVVWCDVRPGPSPRRSSPEQYVRGAGNGVSGVSHATWTDPARYCASLTGSIHSTALPSRASVIAI